MLMSIIPRNKKLTSERGADREELRAMHQAVQNHVMMMMLILEWHPGERWEKGITQEISR